MKQYLKYFHLYKLRSFFRSLLFLPFDFYDLVSNNRPFGVPPRSQIGESTDEYLKDGEKTLGYCRDFAGLKPWKSVLEIGCGTGKLALPLVGFLNEKGFYDGLDESESKIAWCNKHISVTNPNFRFRHTGLLHQTHHPTLQLKPDTRNLQYNNNEYDLVFINSFFTRTLPDLIDFWLFEISRVMKPGAVCMMFVYIVNCESEDMMIKQPAQMHFPSNKGFYRLQVSKDKSLIIAYDEEWLLDKLGKSGLEMITIKYGQWCGRSVYFEHKDLLICRKL